MNREEIERLKEEEKAHLRQLRALKDQFREAQRKKGLLDALKGLDTGGLDAEFDESLRRVQEQNLTSEARFELAMDAVDAAAERERKRLEEEEFDAERRKHAAADLVRQMKSQMLGDAVEHAEAQSGSQPQAELPARSIGRPPAAPAADPAMPDPTAPESDPEATPDPEAAGRPAKTIGRPRSD